MKSHTHLTNICATYHKAWRMKSYFQFSSNSEPNFQSRQPTLVQTFILPRAPTRSTSLIEFSPGQKVQIFCRDPTWNLLMPLYSHFMHSFQDPLALIHFLLLQGDNKRTKKVNNQINYSKFDQINYLEFSDCICIMYSKLKRRLEN